ncbi:AAA domain-containing protein [Ditylenchus destructor]|nr:AAA domain-containing protein [Ditylenchus destructor]
MVDGRKGMAFLSARSFLSNFYTAEEGLFELDGITFVSTEQLYQMEKARFANLENFVQEIMTSVNPVEIKKLGNKVKESAGFKKAGSKKWRELSIEVMRRALEAKFVQNKVLADRLVDTADYILIEANRDDKFWAVGLPLQHASLKNPEKWKGKNMLGKLLMELREKLKQPPSTDQQDMEVDELPANEEKNNLAEEVEELKEKEEDSNELEELPEKEDEHAKPEEGIPLEIEKNAAIKVVDEEEREETESVSADTESSDDIWSQFKNNHFFVSQVIAGEGIICHRITDAEKDDPWIVLIPCDLCKHEVLYISDIVEINEFGDRRPRFQELTSKNWFHEDARKINWQCLAKDYSIVYKKKTTDEPAIVVGSQRTYWDVCSVGLNQKNRVYKYMFPDPEQFESLSVGKIIEVKVVDLWTGSNIGDNYVLPTGTPFKRYHRQLDGETKWVVLGQRIAEYEDWTWPPTRATRSYIQTFEQLMGAAVLASKVFENQLCSGGKVSAKLNWISNDQGICTTASFHLFGEVSKNITRVWKEDSLVTVKGQRTFATAWISEIVNINNSVRVTLEFSWDCQPRGCQNIKDEESNVELRVNTYNLPANIRQRLFQDLSITRAIESNSSQGKILEELIGISPGSLGNPKQQHKILNSNLNARQNDTAALCLDPETTGLIIQEAPPGTGKSKTIGDIAVESLKRKIVTRMAILAPSNQALESLILKFMPKISEVSSDINSRYDRRGQICLLLVSDAAKTKYKQMFQSYKNDLAETEINVLNNYRKRMRYNLRNPNERRAAEVMKGKIHPLVIFTTLQMGELVVSHFSEVTHLWLDEMGKANLMMVASIVLRCFDLKKLLLTGDSRQLQVFEGKLDHNAKKFGFQSPMELTEKFGFQNQVTLNISYRSHPALVKPLSEAFYDSNLVSVDCKGYEVPYMGSYSNPEHSRIALHIFQLLAKTAPPSQITLLNYYRGQAREISSKLPQQFKENVKIVDGFQGEESEVVILVLTATRDQSPRADFEFVLNKKRAAVALSRAKEGMVIIGDLDLLSEAKEWNNYIECAKKVTYPLSAEQAYGIGQGTTPAGIDIGQNSAGVPLNGNARSFYGNGGPFNGVRPLNGHARPFTGIVRPEWQNPQRGAYGNGSRDQRQPLARPYGATWRRDAGGPSGNNSQSRPYRTTYIRSRR